MNTKLCRKCGQIKPKSEFSPRPDRGPKAVRSYCKECTTNDLNAIPRRKHKDLPTEKKERRKQTYQKHRLKKFYGIAPEDYEGMLETQDGKCAICGAREPGGKHNGNFMIDHCHKTGGVRGLLCNRCNLAIGVLKDDLVLIDQVRKYIEAHTTTAP